MKKPKIDMKNKKKTIKIRNKRIKKEKIVKTKIKKKNQKIKMKYTHKTIHRFDRKSSE